MMARGLFFLAVWMVLACSSAQAEIVISPVAPSDAGKNRIPEELKGEAGSDLPGVEDRISEDASAEPQKEPEFEVPNRKFALILGVGSYRNLSEIKNTKNDTQLIAKTLINLDFETQILLDPTSAEIAAAMETYRDKLHRSPSAVSLVYYAGQGAQVDGKSYMIGVDFTNSNEKSALTGTGVPVEPRQEELVAANERGVNLFLYDSSRDDPYAQRQESRGLAAKGLVPVKLAHTNNSVIIYSATSGQQALDGTGDYSPFALAVASALNEPGLDHSALFRKIRDAVIESTSGQQVPEMRDGMSVRYVINPGPRDEEPELDPKTRAATALYEKEPGVFATTYEDGSYALLIGESDYDEISDGRQAWRDLPSVSGEVERLADVLKNVHGFEVKTVIDPDSTELEDALESFVNRHGVKPNARLFIYMAGHGATTTRYGNKIAWFVPRDAPGITPVGPFVNTALNLRRVEEWSEIMEAKHVLWLFDSCFSGAAIKMIGSRSTDEEDGWSVHLHTNPVRRVITAGSENEEVPAESRFTERLIDVLSGAAQIGNGSTITGQQIGAFLREDIVRYTRKQGLPKVTPQSDTIVIPGEEGDIIFRIEPQLATGWQQAQADQ